MFMYILFFLKELSYLVSIVMESGSFVIIILLWLLYLIIIMFPKIKYIIITNPIIIKLIIIFVFMVLLLLILLKYNIMEELLLYIYLMSVIYFKFTTKNKTILIIKISILTIVMITCIILWSLGYIGLYILKIMSVLLNIYMPEADSMLMVVIEWIIDRIK